MVAVAAARLIAVAGLGIDAYVHLDLASAYSEAVAPVNEGILFQADAVLALVTALILILSARCLAFLLGFGIVLLAVPARSRPAATAAGASGHRGSNFRPRE
jgi:hypothetical protein